MKRLILITKNYPFDYGEEFLENEIDLLALKFDRITIFATSVNNAQKKRAVPENVECRAFNISKRELLISAVKNFLFPDKKMAGPRDAAALKGSPDNRISLAFLIAKSKRVYEKIAAEINESEFCGAETVIYSFWLFDTAVAAVKLKEQLRAAGGEARAVSRAHRYDLYEYNSSTGYIPLREYLLNNLDMIYPCSKDGAEYLKDRFKAVNDGGNVKAAYLGVSDCGVCPASFDGVFTIVSCAYVSPVKRIDRLAKALALLPKGKKYKWVHFGGGAMLSEIKKYAGENLSDIECEFKGSVKNSEVIEFYKNNPVDLFVNTSSSEGLPVSIMEAQSFGIPAAATDVGGTSEIVKDKVTGFLINRDFECEELAEVIRLAAETDGGEYSKLRENARKNYLENFSARKNYSQFADMLCKLCKGGN